MSYEISDYNQKIRYVSHEIADELLKLSRFLEESTLSDEDWEISDKLVDNIFSKIRKLEEII